VHSIRKGAGTYASSGTTAAGAPSSVAVNNRGGWTLGGSRDVYLLYERAGDQYVGRILSGMDDLSPKFGAICPDFIYCGRQGAEFDRDSEHVADVEQSQNELTLKVSLLLEASFGNLDNVVAIRKTLRVGLASLLHHFDAAMHYHGVTVEKNVVLEDGVNASVTPSPLRLSPAFRNKMILNLKQYVKVIYPGDAADDVSQQCIMR
jgi:hypothetical protein